MLCHCMLQLKGWLHRRNILRWYYIAQLLYSRCIGRCIIVTIGYSDGFVVGRGDVIVDAVLLEGVGGGGEGGECGEERA